MSVLLYSAIYAQAAPSALTAGSAKYVYKTVGDVELVLHLFEPEGEGPYPAIVFFHGGRWRSGTVGQFQLQARYLQNRGLVVALADYRVSSRHGTSPLHATRDAKSAVRWLREHSDELGIDPLRIAAGGGSAGGHLAAATAVVPGMEEAGEDGRVSSIPNALVLFNPVLDVAKLRPRYGLADEEARTISPLQYVKTGVVPAIIFHGTNDTTVPFASAVAFRDAMQAAGNRAELVSYEGRGHGFFNYEREDGPASKGEDFAHSLELADRFLVSLGFLVGEPSVGDFDFASRR